MEITHFVNKQLFWYFLRFNPVVISLTMERHHLEPEVRNIIVRMSNQGHRQVDIAEAVGVSQSVVSRALARFRETGSANRRPGSGSQRITTQREDRNIVITARRNPFHSARQILNEAQGVLARPLSTQTIRNRLWEVGITSYVPLRRPAATARHRQLRRMWCSERLEEDTNWNAVMFADESRFCLYSDSRRQRVYREQGMRTMPQFMLPSVPFGGGGVMVWAGIYTGGRTSLHFVEGNLTAVRYAREIIEEYVPQTRDLIGTEYRFLDDNARPHRGRVVLQSLQNLGISHLPLPPLSPDLNPIEHMWDALQRRLLDLHPQPVGLQQLSAALQLLWREIPQELCDNIINSMPNRCTQVLANRGHYTRY